MKSFDASLKSNQTRFDLLIHNAVIVSCDDAHTLYPDGMMAVRDGKIVGIGQGSNNSSVSDGSLYQASTYIDAMGKILMPGLINTHCHGGDSLFRGLVEGLPLEPWLEKLWIAESAILNPETIELGSLLGLGENLLNGVTTVLDMFWEPAAIIRAGEALGLRVATGGLFFDPPGIDGATADQREGLARTFFEEHKDHKTLIPSVSVHGAYTVSPENIKTALKVHNDFDALITIHAAETAMEQNIVHGQYGRRVIDHLNHCGLLGESSVLAHCVHLDEGEMELLAKSGTHVSHNPMSNLKLGSGIAPVPGLLAKGINVSLGTDGAVSGNDLDLWKALRLAGTLHNGFNQDALAVSAKDALSMATLNGAQALGIAQEAGSLEIGKRADFIIVSNNQLHSVPIFDPIDHLVFAASHKDVRDVYVAGEQVVKDGKLVNVDQGEIVEKVRALGPTIKATLEN